MNQSIFLDLVITLYWLFTGLNVLVQLFSVILFAGACRRWTYSACTVVSY